MGFFSKKKTKEEKMEEAKKKRNIYESRKSAGEMDTGYKKSRMSFAGGDVESSSRERKFSQKKGGGSFASASGGGNASAGGRSASASSRGWGTASASIGSGNKKKKAPSPRSGGKKSPGGRGGRLGGMSPSSKGKTSTPRKPIGF